MTVQNGDWVVRDSQVEEFAKDNDGECVVAIVPDYFENGSSATCVFTNPDEAREFGVAAWTYYFCDEAELFEGDDWGLEGP